MKSENVIVTNLGRFGYQTNSVKEKGGTLRGDTNLIGVTKFNTKNEPVTNEVMFVRLNPEDGIRNNKFFANVFVSDERLKQANENNNGFIGAIKVEAKEGEKPEYVVEYNHPFDVYLVGALERAKVTPGGYARKDKTKRCANMIECKKQLKEMQLQIASLYRSEKSVDKEKGDEKWQK